MVFIVEDEDGDFVEDEEVPPFPDLMYGSASSFAPPIDMSLHTYTTYNSIGQPQTLIPSLPAKDVPPPETPKRVDRMARLKRFFRFTRPTTDASTQTDMTFVVSSSTQTNMPIGKVVKFDVSTSTHFRMAQRSGFCQLKMNFIPHAHPHPS